MHLHSRTFCEALLSLFSSVSLPCYHMHTTLPTLTQEPILTFIVDYENSTVSKQNVIEHNAIKHDISFLEQ